MDKLLAITPAIHLYFSPYMSLPFLEIFGLTKKEPLLYELLLDNGELPIGKLITLSKLKRATVYKALYALETKGLISKRDFKKKLHVKPQSPSMLTDLADSNIKRAERARFDLVSMLPQLTQAYITSVEKPVVTIYQGVEGLKKIYEDTLSVGKPICAALSTENVDPELFKWVTTVYTRKRIAAKIPVKVIVASGGWAEEYVSRNKKELRETFLVSKELYPFQHEIDIYGDKVAFIDFKKGGSLIGVVIHHPLIAQTTSALWSLALAGALKG